VTILPALLVCAGLQAATTNTTLTVTASASAGAAGLTATGTATLSGIGSGTFSGSLALTTFSGPYTITLSGGAGTITGTLTASAQILSGSGSASATVTGGSGNFAGATGSFPSLTGTGSISATGAINLTFTGAGSITTGGGPSGPPAPSITTIQNNYGNVLPGLPNYAIAPSALFYIQGTNLANTTTALLSSADPGLQTTVSGVTVTVTAGGSSRQCPLYYLSPTQIDAVLPGATPSGIATITVANNGTTSAAFSITVAQSAFGILSYNGSLAATYDANNNIITSANSANPGQAIVLWGSGVGFDPADDDKLFPQKQDNLTNIPMQVFVGGIEASIAYRGRSQFPGVDQVVITIPSNVPTGCYVSLAVVSGNIVSNATTIPVAASGKTCTDTNTGLTPDIIAGLSGKTTIKQGFLTVSQSTSVSASGSQTTSSVGGIFSSISGFTGSGGANQVSIGSCLVTTAQASTGSIPSFTGLDAGASIAVNGPGGSLNIAPLNVPGFSSVGFYSTSNGTVPSGFLPSTGGTFTFDNGSGGKDVGHFNASIVMPQQFTWTNASSVTSVTRSQGVTVTWSGGTPGSFVTISGGSTATVNGGSYTVTFTCNAPISAGQFAVPTPVLLVLPASNNGSLSVGDYTNTTLFTASGLDLGLTGGSSSTSRTVAYN
jgi:uncharacterized protein (TIGR03437 family)